MRLPSNFIVGLLIVSGLSLSLGALAASGPSSKLEFQAVGPAGLQIQGEGGRIYVGGSAEAWEFETRVDALKTGIELRDEHLKKYLKADKFPLARLTIPRSAVPLPVEGKDLEGVAQGQLTLHGQTKSVSVPFKVSRVGAELRGQGLVTIDLTAFGIEVPCYLGVCVDKVVKVKAKLSVAAQ